MSNSHVVVRIEVKRGLNGGGNMKRVASLNWKWHTRPLRREPRPSSKLHVDAVRLLADFHCVFRMHATAARIESENIEKAS